MSGVKALKERVEKFLDENEKNSFKSAAEAKKVREALNAEKNRLLKLRKSLESDRTMRNFVQTVNDVVPYRFM